MTAFGCIVMDRYSRRRICPASSGRRSTRAAGTTPEKAPPSVIHAPRRRHSEKPLEFYDLFETVSPGPYLELFARNAREGWTSWGNEV